ncbi:hypothetical protein BaRGS_00009994 [Batillaria attramentaria]|uniref:Uncharacterized protein n=1 Tax=Batillaria attramentaria TaxID=370345 RepID=A0ABD0LH71_9CAEN
MPPVIAHMMMPATLILQCQPCSQRVSVPGRIAHVLIVIRVVARPRSPETAKPNRLHHGCQLHDQVSLPVSTFWSSGTNVREVPGLSRRMGRQNGLKIRDQRRKGAREWWPSTEQSEGGRNRSVELERRMTTQQTQPKEAV